MSDDENIDFGLVMPFVTVTSKGGPHDDESYTAGYEMGCMWATLEAMPQAAQTVRFLVREPSKEQADLIAMHHGWEIVNADDDAEYGWLWLDLRPADLDPSSDAL